MTESDDPITIALVGTKAVAATGAAATPGLIGFGGQVTAAGAIGAAGIGIGAYSGIQQGRAAAAQGSFQQKIANRNAQQAELEAEGKRQAAAEAAIQRERQGRALKGSQVAKFAKSGVSMRGSPLSVLVQTAQDIEADRLTILREGAIGASTDEFRAGILRAEGSAAKSRGLASKRGSILSAVGSTATGASSLYLRNKKASV